MEVIPGGKFMLVPFWNPYFEEGVVRRKRLQLEVVDGRRTYQALQKVAGRIEAGERQAMSRLLLRVAA